MPTLNDYLDQFSTAQQPSVWQRIQTGLLGPSQNYGGLLDASAQRMAQQRAGMAMAGSLLQASGRSAQPTSTGQAIGGSILAGQQAQDASTTDALRAKILQQQLMTKGIKKPIAVMGPDGKTPIFVSEEDAIGKQPVASRENNIPSAVSEWQFYSSLPPADQARYIQMKRAEQFRMGEVNGVQTAVTAGAGAAPGMPNITATPLTTLQNEGAAKSELARQGAAGAQLGEAQGKIAGGIQTKGSNSQTTLQLLDQADSLVDKATGSAGGAAVDATQALVGKTNEGAKAIAQLKVLQAGLMLNMPRMEGPQSDRDTQLYREASASIGDATVPRDVKKAALSTIREIQTRYGERAADAGAPSAVGVPTQFPTSPTFAPAANDPLGIRRAQPR